MKHFSPAEIRDALAANAQDIDPAQPGYDPAISREIRELSKASETWPAAINRVEQVAIDLRMSREMAAAFKPFSQMAIPPRREPQHRMMGDG